MHIPIFFGLSVKRSMTIRRRVCLTVTLNRGASAKTYTKTQSIVTHCEPSLQNTRPAPWTRPCWSYRSSFRTTRHLNRSDRQSHIFVQLRLLSPLNTSKMGAFLSLDLTGHGFWDIIKRQPMRINATRQCTTSIFWLSLAPQMIDSLAKNATKYYIFSL